MMNKKTNREPENQGPAVFITGVSSGLGKATAMLLLQAGYFVIGTVRCPEDGLYLKPAGGLSVTLDVTNSVQIEDIKQQMKQLLNNRPLYGIINNAGISLCVPWQEVALDDFRIQLEVNLIGVIAVTRALIPFLKKDYGKIIMISSTAARFTTANMGPYSCSKYALEAMTESLRQELWHDGIDVISIQPGPVKTPIFHKSRQWVEKNYAAAWEQGVFGKFADVTINAGETGMPPRRVAQTILKTLRARRPRLRQLVSNNPLWFLFQPLIPTRLFDRLVATLFYGKRKKNSS